ncbi:MAG TPA: ScyD/ScyE family protein [Chloroflexota bacterium]|nr:ScyD/ScyE family protein [Chloroflexota bacterium]
MRRITAALLSIAGLLALTVAPVSVSAQPPLPPNAKVVASGLINPRGMVFASDGSLIVAEAGSPPEGFDAPMGPPTPEFRPGTNFTGRVSRIDLSTGQRSTVVENLPSSASSFGDTLGPAAVAYLGSDLYVLQSAGPVHGWPNYPSGVYKVNPDGTTRLVANLDAFNAKNPVGLIAPDDEISNPYGMVSDGSTLWITDGNRNQVYRVTADGGITRVADLSSGHPITTGIALTPSGGVMTSELTAVPYVPGSGRVLNIDAAGNVTTVGRLTTMATGLAALPDGGAYVTEISANAGPPEFFAPFSGRVVRVTASGEASPLAEGLMFPTQAVIGPDGAVYVANFSMAGDHGEGQIVRIETRGM